MKRRFFYLIAAIVLIMTNNKGNCQSQITMKTSKGHLIIGLVLQGLGKTTIDWGDGKKDNFTLSKDYYDGVVEDLFYYEHIYSDTSVHTITIIGENIEELRCEHNRLTKLDVSKNAALKKLRCNNNQLTNLDVSKNTALRYLNCNNNNFSETTLNEMLESLCDAWDKNKAPKYTKDGYLFIDGNSGTDTCDKSIAKKKGWRIISW